MLLNILWDIDGILLCHINTLQLSSSQRPCQKFKVGRLDSTEHWMVTLICIEMTCVPFQFRTAGFLLNPIKSPWNIIIIKYQQKGPTNVQSDQNIYYKGITFVSYTKYYIIKSHRKDGFKARPFFEIHLLKRNVQCHVQAIEGPFRDQRGSDCRAQRGATVEQGKWWYRGININIWILILGFLCKYITIVQY